MHSEMPGDSKHVPLHWGCVSVYTQLSHLVVAAPLRSLGIWHQNVVLTVWSSGTAGPPWGTAGPPWGTAVTDGSYLFGVVYMLSKLLHSGLMQGATLNALHGLWIRCLYILTRMSSQLLLLSHGSCCMACDCLVSLEWGFTSGPISCVHGAGCQKHTGWNPERAAG